MFFVLGKKEPLGRSFLIGLFFLCFFSYGYFFQYLNANESVRFAQVRSLYTRAALDIPPETDTLAVGDKYYPNKPPGVTFLGFFFWAGFSTFSRMVGGAGHLANLLLYFVAWLTIGLPSALLSVLLFMLCRAKIRDDWAAFLITIAYSFGSLAFPYATLFFSHQLAAFFITASFALLWDARQFIDGQISRDGPPSNTSLLQKVLFRNLFLAGFFAGYSVLCEYQSLLAVLCLSIYCLLVIRPKRLKASFFIALTTALILLACYNFRISGHALLFYANFGDPVAHLSFLDRIRNFSLGVDGIAGSFNYPRMETLINLLISPCRGLFFYNPWLAVILPALLIFLFKKERHSMENGVSVMIFILYLAANAGFAPGKPEYWGGGWAIGPRYLVGTFPLVIWFSADLFKNKLIRGLLTLPILVSIVLMVLATAIDPKTPTTLNPLLSVYWPNYLAMSYPLYDWSAFNLGKLAGLPKGLHLAPLFIFWTIMTGLLIRRIDQNGRASGYEKNETSFFWTALLMILGLVVYLPFVWQATGSIPKVS